MPAQMPCKHIPQLIGVIAYLCNSTRTGRVVRSGSAEVQLTHDEVRQLRWLSTNVEGRLGKTIQEVQPVVAEPHLVHLVRRQNLSRPDCDIAWNCVIQNRASRKRSGNGSVFTCP